MRAVLFVLVALAACSPARADLVNGGFDTGTFFGWAVAHASGDGLADSTKVVFGGSPQGLFYGQVGVQGGGPGVFIPTGYPSLKQSFNAQAGQQLQYSISWDLFAGLSAGLPLGSSSSFSVGLVGPDEQTTLLQQATIQPSPGNDPLSPFGIDGVYVQPWMMASAPITETGLYSLIVNAIGNPGGSQAGSPGGFRVMVGIDDVRLVTVPEPSAFVSIAIAAAVIGVAANIIRGVAAGGTWSAAWSCSFARHVSRSTSSRSSIARVASSTRRSPELLGEASRREPSADDRIIAGGISTANQNYG